MFFVVVCDVDSVAQAAVIARTGSTVSCWGVDEGT